MSTAVTPEVRKDILDNLTRTCELWVQEVMKGYFEHPKSPFAKQMMLEAFAAALVQMADRSSEGRSIMQTFIHELQDAATKEIK
jgi:hypothetical protein